MRAAVNQSVLYAWLMVLLDDYWRVLLVGSLVLVLFSGVSLATTSDVVSTETEVSGELLLTLEPAEERITDMGVTLPGDGVLPVDAGDTLEVTARYVPAPGYENRTLELIIDRTLKREVGDGSLWRVSTRLANERSNGSIAVASRVNMSQELGLAADIDNRLNTTSGSIGIEIRAWVTNTSDDTYPTVAGTTIRRSQDYLRFDAEVIEPVREETTRVDQSSNWSVILTAISLSLTSGIVGLRWFGVLPLSPSSRGRYRFAVVRWRYSDLVVATDCRIATEEATRLDDPRSLVMLAQRTHRPIHIDDRGVAAVSIESHTYWWSVTPAFKSDTA